jgi:hypothetical protein
MSSFSRAVRVALIGVALTLPLAACTGIRPVYSDAALGAKRVNVVYAAPNNRLEQIIYNDLALRLGKSSGVSAPTVTVSAYGYGTDLNTTTVGTPVNAKQAVVGASLTVTAPDGSVLFSGGRTQTADYTSSSQTLANQQAVDSAQRRAALLLADTLRLDILGALAKWPH